MPFSTITVKSQLIMPKSTTKKQKNTGNQKNLLTNYIFLKVVTNNATLLAQIILHNKLILYQYSTVQRR